jgi:iron(III) transport system permease protein
VLVIISAAVAVAILLPILFIVLQADHAGWSLVDQLLFRRLTRVLLVNTIELAVLVGAACAILGTGAAYLVERTNLIGRRVWAVLLVLPVAIPDFVVGYAWHSIAPAIKGLGGAVLVMSLALYPLVYLPVAAALRRTDPAEEEVARSLGLGSLQTFFRVTLRQVRPALTGGCLVVFLALLAEYGAFEILGFQTFTTTIFSEYNQGFDLAAASALTLVLVFIGMLVLGAEAAVSSRGRISRATGHAARVSVRRRLPARQQMAALAGVVAVTGAGLGLPIGTLAYWMSVTHNSTLQGASLWAAFVHTASYSVAAAALATGAALPVALLSVRFRSPVTVLLERSTLLVQSLPGLVIALALIFFGIHYAHSLYQTGSMLVIAYAVLFFPLALICVRASVSQAPRRLEEVGRSLGRGPLSVLMRVTIPLVGPGLAAAVCLVFLSAATELTATLLLVPYGVHTLASQFWAYQGNASYGAAAPYAVVIVALAAIPGVVLTRYFDRRPGGAVT